MPEFMFVTTEDLNKHILAEHGSDRWVCNYCANEADGLHRDDTFVYDTAEDWVSHVKDDHLSNIPVSQLKELSLLSKRKFVMPMECPLCDVAISTMQAELDGHIAGHLHSFALRALPWGLSQGSQGSHGSDTLRFSARTESENSCISSRWENLSNLSDVEWPDHEKPVINNWSDWHHKKDEVVIRKKFIDDWVQNISRFLTDQGLTDSSGLTPDKKKKEAENPGIVDVPETPPAPSCAIPFHRDPDFVDHGTILDQILEKCAVPASRTALVGLGGLGKSQFAIECCYRIIDQSPEMWVFWVHASNTARLEQGYREIADQVKLPGRSDLQADVFQLVYNWLRNEKSGKWLLVLDNADDTAVLSRPLTKAPPRSFLSYLPRTRNGSVLVTSRTRSAALHLVEQSDIIPVESMDDASAQILLRRKLGKEGDEDSIAELVRALDFIPLALVLAAEYIQQRAPRLSVRQYLAEFYKSDQDKKNLLYCDAGNLRRDHQAENSILLMWQVSFNYILRARPAAANLLSLISFCSRQGIPETLLRNQNRTSNRHGGIEDSDTDNAVSENEFEENILMLQDYMFVRVTTNATTFDTYGLVQLATRYWLEGRGELEMWKQQYIDDLCTAFPIVRYKNKDICQALFPHAMSALSQPPKHETSLLQWALLLYKVAWYAYEKRNLSDAEKLSISSMMVREKLLGKEHIDTLESMIMVGLVAMIAERWEEAEKLFVEATEIRKRVLGSEHPDALNSMESLAYIYQNQGQLKEAEELGIQVVEIRKRVLGSEHLDTLASKASLVSIYQNQGRLKEAEELGIQVVETRKRVLRSEHPDTLASMASLVSIYQNQERLKEAEELGIQVVEIRKRVLGSDHPDTLASIAGLTYIY